MDPDQSLVEAFGHHPALAGAYCRPQGRPGLLFPQPGLDPVEMLDLAEEPAAELGRLIPGLMELPPDMRPATRQHYGLGMLPHESWMPRSRRIAGCR